MSQIQRQHEFYESYTADVLANLTAIKQVNAKGAAGWRIYNKSGAQVVLTFYDAPWHTSEKNLADSAANQYNTGTFLAALDQSTGSQISLTIPNNDSMDVPAALFPCGAFKVVCAAGAAVIDISEKG